MVHMINTILVKWKIWFKQIVNIMDINMVVLLLMLVVKIL